MRNDGAVQRIVEHKDATDAQRAITEVYSGIMAVPANACSRPLAGRLTNNNAQGEYYPDRRGRHGRDRRRARGGHRIADAVQVAGVNSPLQLAELERAHRLRQPAP